MRDGEMEIRLDNFRNIMELAIYQTFVQDYAIVISNNSYRI